MARRKNSVQTVALSGVLSAAGLVLLLGAGVMPTGWVGVTAVAGFPVALCVASAGYASGGLCYVVTALLGLLLVPAKHVPVLFACLFGLYPVLKNIFERCRSKAATLVLKLAFFEAVLFSLYFAAYQLLFQSAAEAWTLPVPFLAVVAIGGALVLLVYDFAFTKVMAMLQARLVPQLRRLFAGR